MPGIFTLAEGPTWRAQTPADRVLPVPDLFRQGLINDCYLAWRRVVGSLKASSGDDGNAHGREIIAHYELVIVDDCRWPTLVGGVILDKSSDRVRSSIRRQTRHGSCSENARD